MSIQKNINNTQIFINKDQTTGNRTVIGRVNNDKFSYTLFSNSYYFIVYQYVGTPRQHPTYYHEDLPCSYLGFLIKGRDFEKNCQRLVSQRNKEFYYNIKYIISITIKNSRKIIDEISKIHKEHFLPYYEYRYSHFDGTDYKLSEKLGVAEEDFYFKTNGRAWFAKDWFYNMIQCSGSEMNPQSVDISCITICQETCDYYNSLSVLYKKTKGFKASRTPAPAPLQKEISKIPVQKEISKLPVQKEISKIPVQKIDDESKTELLNKFYDQISAIGKEYKIENHEEIAGRLTGIVAVSYESKKIEEISEDTDLAIDFIKDVVKELKGNDELREDFIRYHVHGVEIYDSLCILEERIQRQELLDKIYDQISDIFKDFGTEIHEEVAGRVTGIIEDSKLSVLVNISKDRDSVLKFIKDFINDIKTHDQLREELISNDIEIYNSLCKFEEEERRKCALNQIHLQVKDMFSSEKVAKVFTDFIAKKCESEKIISIAKSRDSVLEMVRYGIRYIRSQEDKVRKSFVNQIGLDDWILLCRFEDRERQNESDEIYNRIYDFCRAHSFPFSLPSVFREIINERYRLASLSPLLASRDSLLGVLRDIVISAKDDDRIRAKFITSIDPKDAKKVWASLCQIFKH